MVREPVEDGNILQIGNKIHELFAMNSIIVVLQFSLTMPFIHDNRTRLRGCGGNTQSAEGRALNTAIMMNVVSVNSVMNLLGLSKMKRVLMNPALYPVILLTISLLTPICFPCPFAPFSFPVLSLAPTF